MRRDHFELDVEHIDWVDTDADPEKPHVSIVFNGSQDLLRDRLTTTEGELLAAEGTDVAYRLREDHEVDPDAEGVVSVTNRVTGEFVLELNEQADDVFRFIRAAREYGRADDGDGRFHVDIRVGDEELVTYEKETFLVYDAEGNLLRAESLIPSGVEL